VSYAEGTAVPAEKSRAEIEKLLRKQGAVKFASGWDGDRAMISFQLVARTVRIVLSFPPANDKRFTHRPGSSYLRRTPAQAMAAHEGEVRRRWRALLLVLKAKLESVASGIATLEEEFMPWVVLPDGRTVGELMHPEIARAYETGQMPSFLPALPARGETGGGA
jgi:hypothetical protein